MRESRVKISSLFISFSSPFAMLLLLNVYVFSLYVVLTFLLSHVFSNYLFIFYHFLCDYSK